MHLSRFHIIIFCKKPKTRREVLHNEKMETAIPGIYAIGDVSNNQYQQITIAVANGTVAALNIINYLNN